MKPEIVLKPEFAEFIPEELKEHTLYVAAKYRTVVHLCCCGCGRKVVTPLSPASWKLTFDGASITLYPSVGNWNLPCQSHYLIEKNRVIWATRWTSNQIQAGRAREERAMADYYAGPESARQSDPGPPARSATSSAPAQPLDGPLRRLLRRLFG